MEEEEEAELGSERTIAFRRTAAGAAQMDGGRDRSAWAAGASSSPIHFSDFVRLIGERERERTEWTSESGINEVGNPFPGAKSGWARQSDKGRLLGLPLKMKIAGGVASK